MATMARKDPASNWLKSLMERAFRRISQLLWLDPTPTEISNCWAAMLSGGSIIMAWPMVRGIEGYQFAFEIMHGLAWAVILVALATAQGIAVLKRCYPIRRLCAAGSMLVWLVLFMATVSASVTPPAAWLYLVFSIGAAWSYVQLPIVKKG